MKKQKKRNNNHGQLQNASFSHEEWTKVNNYIKTRCEIAKLYQEHYFEKYCIKFSNLNQNDYLNIIDILAFYPDLIYFQSISKKRTSLIVISQNILKYFSDSYIINHGFDFKRFIEDSEYYAGYNNYIEHMLMNEPFVDNQIISFNNYDNDLLTIMLIKYAFTHQLHNIGSKSYKKCMSNVNFQIYRPILAALNKQYYKDLCIERPNVLQIERKKGIFNED